MECFERIFLVKMEFDNDHKIIVKIFVKEFMIKTKHHKKIKIEDIIKMKIESKLLQFVHLDKNYSLLSGRNLKVIYDFFTLLDVHEEQALNDVQFCAFLKTITDLTTTQIYKVSISTIFR